MMRKIFLRSLGVLAVLFVLIQLVPYGRGHANPLVAGEPAWDSPATRELARRACFDCHSNETRWPWYSNVAPVSWLVQKDVDEGREELNFSQWTAGSRGGHDASEEVLEGEMPLAPYLWTHPEARLDEAERRQLAAGLARTLGGAEHGEEGEHGGR